MYIFLFCAREENRVIGVTEMRVKIRCLRMYKSLWGLDLEN
jgi:hypothetical protein